MKKTNLKLASFYFVLIPVFLLWIFFLDYNATLKKKIEQNVQRVQWMLKQKETDTAHKKIFSKKSLQPLKLGLLEASLHAYKLSEQLVEMKKMTKDNLIVRLKNANFHQFLRWLVHIQESYHTAIVKIVLKPNLESSLIDIQMTLRG